MKPIDLHALSLSQRTKQIHDWINFNGLFTYLGVCRPASPVSSIVGWKLIIFLASRCGHTINPFKMFISVLMVITGSINTIAVKYIILCPNIIFCLFKFRHDTIINQCIAMSELWLSQSCEGLQIMRELRTVMGSWWSSATPSSRYILHTVC